MRLVYVIYELPSENKSINIRQNMGHGLYLFQLSTEPIYFKEKFSKSVSNSLQSFISYKSFSLQLRFTTMKLYAICTRQFWITVTDGPRQ